MQYNQIKKAIEISKGNKNDRNRANENSQLFASSNDGDRMASTTGFK